MKPEIEVRQNKQNETMLDTVLILSLIIGALTNIILFLVGWWICDTTAQKVVVFLCGTFFIAYIVFNITIKILNYEERKHIRKGENIC